MNYALFELLNRYAGRAGTLDAVMRFAATWLIFVVFAVAAVIVARELYHRRLRPVLRLGVAAALAFGTAMLLAHVSDQQRPFQSHRVHQLIAHDPGVSMPSDHATAAFALAFGIGLFVNRQWGIVLGVAAVAVGVSRIWVGVHYPSDIAVAAMIAALSVLEVALWGRWRRVRTSARGRLSSHAASAAEPGVS
jgi:undecaprenyl-diphosphatase